MRLHQYAASATAATYGVAVGASTLILPLLAFKVGYSAAAIGYLAAASAGAQLVARLTLTAALKRFPDRLLVAGSSIVLIASFALVITSHEPAFFAAAMACQGVSRAGFWTGIQTHVVRESATVSKSLARIILMGNIGLLAGPILAGFMVEISTHAALYLGAGIAAVATTMACFMKRLPLLLESVESTRVSWLEPSILAGCMSVGISGSWRGLLSSYVPVILLHSRQSGGTIGILMAVANAAGIVAAASLARSTPRNLIRVVAACCVGVGTGVALIGLSAPWPAAAGACLFVGGYCAGALQILGTALATDAVSPEARGRAIALTGTVRAGTMLAAPLVVAAMLQAMALSVALGVIGTAHGLPSLLLRRLKR